MEALRQIGSKFRATFQSSAEAATQASLASERKDRRSGKNRIWVGLSLLVGAAIVLSACGMEVPTPAPGCDPAGHTINKTPVSNAWNDLQARNTAGQLERCVKGNWVKNEDYLKQKEAVQAGELVTPLPIATRQLNPDVAVTLSAILAQNNEKVVEQIDIKAPNGLIFSFSKIPPESGLTKTFLRKIIDTYCDKNSKVTVGQNTVPVSFVDDAVFKQLPGIGEEDLATIDSKYYEDKLGLKSLAIIIDKDRMKSLADEFSLELKSVYADTVQHEVFHVSRSHNQTRAEELLSIGQEELLASALPSLLMPKAEQPADQPVIKAPNDLIFYVDKIPSESGLTKDIFQKYINLYCTKEAKVVIIQPFVSINFMTDADFLNQGKDVPKDALAFTKRSYSGDGLGSINIYIDTARVKEFADKYKVDINKLYERTIAEQIYFASQSHYKNSEEDKQNREMEQRAAVLNTLSIAPTPIKDFVPKGKFVPTAWEAARFYTQDVMGPKWHDNFCSYSYWYKDELYLNEPFHILVNQAMTAKDDVWAVCGSTPETLISETYGEISRANIVVNPRTGEIRAIWVFGPHMNNFEVPGMKGKKISGLADVMKQNGLNIRAGFGDDGVVFDTILESFFVQELGINKTSADANGYSLLDTLFYLNAISVDTQTGEIKLKPQLTGARAQARVRNLRNTSKDPDNPNWVVGPTTYSRIFSLEDKSSSDGGLKILSTFPLKGITLVKPYQRMFLKMGWKGDIIGEDGRIMITTVKLNDSGLTIGFEAK